MDLRGSFGLASAAMTTIAVLLGSASTGRAGAIQAGDLIVTDFANGTLDDVNPVTGASFVIAGGFTNPQGIAVDAQGTIFVSDIGTSTIYKVAPGTGVVTAFSGSGLGSGPALNRPFEMAFNSSDRLFVADGGAPNGNTTAVLAIDSSGNRTLVAGNNGSSNNLFGQFVAGLALDSKGALFASAPTAHTVYDVGPGTATPLSSALSAPQGLAFGAGDLLAVNGNPSNPAIWSIDPTSGNATTLSDNNGFGNGPAFNVLRGILVAPGGTIYATDVGNDEIYRVSAANGDRSVVAGSGVGGSTFGGLTYGIAVYPSVSNATAPEPSGLALCGIAGATLAGYFGRQRRGTRWLCR